MSSIILFSFLFINPLLGEPMCSFTITIMNFHLFDYGVGVRVGVLEGVREGVAVAVGVFVGVRVFVGVGVLVGVRVGVLGRTVGVGVSVTMAAKRFWASRRMSTVVTSAGRASNKCQY